jgi:hypothetical protein
VNGVKDGVDDSMLPEKWKDSQKKDFHKATEDEVEVMEE